MSIPEFFNKNRHILVALLYLDFDLYEPTKVALETIVPRMPSGAVIAFDELNDSRRPGESVALMELLDLRETGIRKFPEESHISYVVL